MPPAAGRVVRGLPRCGPVKTAASAGRPRIEAIDRRAPRIAIAGWYGHDNIGDQLLASSVVASLRRTLPGARLTLLSQNPADARVVGCAAMRPLLPTAPLLSARGVRHLVGHTLRTRGQWWRLWMNLDMLVVGGGSVLHDRFRDNLLLWRRLLRLYKARGARVVFYGVGLDPVAPAAEPLRDEILQLADGLSVRDTASAELAARVLGTDRVRLAADPVVSWPVAPGHDDTVSRPLTIGLNLRPLATTRQGEIERAGLRLAEALMARLDARIAFLPMFPGDVALGETIRASLPARLAPRWRLLPHLPDRLTEHAALYRDLDAVVSMRLHALVLGACAGRPIVGLSCDPKIRGFLTDVGLPGYVVDVEGRSHPGPALDVEVVVARVEEALQRRTTLLAEVAAGVERLQHREQENIRLVIELLSRSRPHPTAARRGPSAGRRLSASSRRPGRGRSGPLPGFAADSGP